MFFRPTSFCRLLLCASLMLPLSATAEGLEVTDIRVEGLGEIIDYLVNKA